VAVDGLPTLLPQNAVLSSLLGDPLAQTGQASLGQAFGTYNPGVRLPKLTEGRLLRRYKRFLADVALNTGEVVTAVVPNTGSLISCVEPGYPVWLREEAGAQRKYRYTWTLVRPKRSLVCVDTAIPNRVVYEYAAAQKIPQLAGYREYIREMPYGEHSRADLCCRVHNNDMLGRVWVEVKSTTLLRGAAAEFPDAVTSRGLKHLIELQKMVQAGERALQVFFIQRADAKVFRPADDIDPAYGAELRRAVKSGVEVVALQAQIRLDSITLKGQIPLEL
jgi:sugar fermentation stimulation protein A